MKVQFAQFYIEPGVDFRFSWRFSVSLGEQVTDLVVPSPTFIEKYGSDFDLIFRISAKQGLKENEIKGPTVFRKKKDVEYSIFLPFDVICREPDVSHAALEFLLKGVCDVFDRLDIDAALVGQKKDGIIGGICSDPKMFDHDDSDDD